MATLVLYIAIGATLLQPQISTAAELSEEALKKLAANFKAYELSNVSVTGPNDRNLDIMFSAFGSKYELKLHLAIQRQVNVIIASKYGQRSLDLEPSYYSGRIETAVASFAHGILENGVFSGSVYANGHGSDDPIYIEPLCTFVNEHNCSNVDSVIYKRSDVLMDEKLKKAMRYKTSPKAANKIVTPNFQYRY